MLRYNYFDLAADILAENSDLTYKYLRPQEYEFLDALILAQSAPGFFSFRFLCAVVLIRKNLCGA